MMNYRYVGSYVVAIAIAANILCTPSNAQYQTPEPYELTSRGVIASDSTQRYKMAVEDCYKGQPGNAPKGPGFLGCLKKQARIQDGILSEIYKGTEEYLKKSSSQITKLRNSEITWIKFRDANCVFARSVGGNLLSEEWFYDCLLRTIIDRQAELRSLVGD